MEKAEAMPATIPEPGPGPSADLGPGTQPYLCFAGQDWWYHNQAHSDFQLMRQVARHRPVLVVNSIGMRMPIPGRTTQPVRRILRKLRSVARRVQAPVPELPNFRVMSPLSLPFSGRPRLRAVNAWLVAGQVRMACARLRMRRPVCVVTVPTAQPVLDHLPHGQVVFNRSDKHSDWPEVDTASISQLEDRLLRTADHVLYVSHALMESERPLAGDRAVFIDHGVDLDHFRPTPEERQPGDLRSIPHPRVGFFGALDELVDYDFLEQVAKGLPEANFVFIGAATVPMERLASLPNVHVLGFRDYADIPRYGSGFDVAIMAWVPSDWIRWCNPIKLKEYLALGLPVVSTPFPELAWYGEVVHVGQDPEEFAGEVRALLARPTIGDDGAARRRRVADESWASKAALLVALCEGPRGHRGGEAAGS